MARHFCNMTRKLLARVHTAPPLWVGAVLSQSNSAFQYKAQYHLLDILAGVPKPARWLLQLGMSSLSAEGEAAWKRWRWFRRCGKLRRGSPRCRSGLWYVEQRLSWEMLLHWMSSSSQLQSRRGKHLFQTLLLNLFFALERLRKETDRGCFSRHPPCRCCSADHVAFLHLYVNYHLRV